MPNGTLDTWLAQPSQNWAEDLFEVPKKPNRAFPGKQVVRVLTSPNVVAVDKPA